MSEALESAAAALREKMAGSGFAGRARVEVEGEGALLVEGEEVRVAADGAEDADVTIRADLDTFRAIFSGELSPATAFMTGRMEVEGDMGVAMELGQALA